MRYLKLLSLAALTSFLNFENAFSNESPKYYVTPDNHTVVEEIYLENEWLTNPSYADNTLLEGSEFEETEFEGSELDKGWCRLIAGATFGKFIGLQQGYAEFGFFAGIPVRQNAHIFVDAREFNLSNKDWAGSLGIGYRYACENVCDGHYEIYGCNVYYDYRQTHFKQDICCLENCDRLSASSKGNFNRIGVGAEYLSTCFDFRVNGYIPIVKSTHFGRAIHFDLLGNNFGSYRNSEFLRWGVDGELGKGYSFCNACFNTYLGVGGYYYKHKDLEGLGGVQARFEISWREFITLQFRYSYDPHYSSKYQGQILVTVPLRTLFNCLCLTEECCEPSDVCIPWDQRVQRNYVPFVDRGCCWKWNW